MFNHVFKTLSYRRLKAAALAAALCICMFAGGCGDKTPDAGSDLTPPSAVSLTEQAETPDNTVSSSELEKDPDSKSKAEESKKDESKSSSKSSAADKKTSEPKTDSKSQAAVSTQTENESKEENMTESKTETKTESKEESKKAESKQDANPPAESKAAASTAETSGYKAGQTVTLDIRFGNIAMNGQPAKIGAYDYWITYNDSVLQYVDAVEQTASDLKMVNDKEKGKVKIAHIAAMGFDDDYTGAKRSTYKVTFKVLQDTTDLGISCRCPSLTAVSMDGKDTLTLISKQSPEDKYSEYVITAE